MFDLPFFSPLSATQRKTWNDQGYLHLKKAISTEEITAVRNRVEWHWANPSGNPHNVDVITGDYAGQCFTMNDTPLTVRGEAYKLNNLFLRDDTIRSVALSRRLKRIMGELLQSEPMICNSLNFERGSQQDAHIDSWYMPAPDDESMVAASISLDPVDDTNGPIFFYPGSHKIAPYRFSDGRLNVIDAEFADCRAYVQAQIEELQLPLIRYQGGPGDVFIWHGQLIHGGSPIRDFSRTRSSLVVHYWRASDVPQQSVVRDKAGRAYLAHTLRGELQPVAA
ncbi:phytanoyl-CoA dioxygenase family protein [Brevundimonas sp. SL130]|uniref:phytanoyl-CoA dioxygenase family protein n=1 Tax=Brevundimonas sp. SL130 TaxID=2995143 RepID=UPI00226CF2DB|nr:phytanoyl-CoA dioxygenase family protein [Brevundimonas sp. SL130]WAC60320.1 phytanoyl-CoA dioxygenase family protein [Brevundimonas sp. SL130]